MGKDIELRLWFDGVLLRKLMGDADFFDILTPKAKESLAARLYLDQNCLTEELCANYLDYKIDPVTGMVKMIPLPGE